MLKELFSYMKQYKKYAWISLACIAVECIFELVIPLIMADMVDVGIANGDQDYILHKGLVMIGCAGLALVLGICSAGYFFGNFPWVKLHLDKIIWAMILVPGLVILWGAWRSRSRSAGTNS